MICRPAGRLARTAMHIFRCYFLDDQEHITVSENIEADTLVEATDRAHAMLRGRPHHRSIEIWQGARRLYPVEAIGRAVEAGHSPP